MTTDNEKVTLLEVVDLVLTVLGHALAWSVIALFVLASMITIAKTSETTAPMKMMESR
jgi:hypothetical protein